MPAVFNQPTPIHRLHPFSKMFTGTFLAFFGLGLMRPAALAVLLLFLLMVFLMARVRPTLRQWLYIILVLSLFSALNYRISGPVHMARYTMRLIIFMAGVPLLAATTAPQDVSRSLSRLRLPPGLIVAIMLVWRFFPIISREVRDIREANLLRLNGVRSRCQEAYRGFLLPLTFALVEYADRLPLTLELRGFDPGARRTCYRQKKIGLNDLIFLGLALIAAGLAAAIEWGGVGL